MLWRGRTMKEPKRYVAADAGTCTLAHPVEHRRR